MNNSMQSFSSKSVAVAVAVAASEPWVSRSFLKDSKLRTSERYWQNAQQQLHDSILADDGTRASSLMMILPDALTWRKYLRLIRSLLDLAAAAATDSEEPEQSPFQWIVLESVSEALDHRNQSLREAAAPQERSLLLRLMENNIRNNKNSRRILAFPDLSVRTKDDDEWDLLQYPRLPIVERSRQALLRAGHLLLSLQPSSASSRSCCYCWLIVDENETAKLPLNAPDDDSSAVDTMQYKTMDEIIAAFGSEMKLSTEQLERLHQLKVACEEEYQHRNAPPEAKADSTELIDLSPDEIRQRLLSGRLLRGRLNVTRENVREAFVTTTSSNAQQRTYFIHHDHFNRAFHQDMVLIEPLPESQWGRPVGKRRLVHQSDDNDDNDANNDSLDATSSIPPAPSARVVAITQPARRVFVATLTDSPNTAADSGAVLVVPRDVRIPKIRIRTRSWQRFVGMRLQVEIVDWEADSHYPIGHCTQILGPIGDLETEIQALLIENQVQLDPFSTEALACLPVPGSDWRVPQTEIEQRRDLRSSRRIFSVDPPGCQDIDDTMHAEVLPNGDIEVGVHIADVTYFVKHNSKLDLEAQVRGTTFYLVDRRFDMLPALLSSDLCSLHGGINRLAVSVIWILSPDLEQIKSTWFGRTVIHNCAAMAYDQADNILHDKAPDEPGAPLPPPLTAGTPVDPRLIGSLKKDLGILTKLARKLRKDREEIGGAVDLSSGESGSELKFALDNNGNPIKVAPKKDKEIHHTIAEMMIMANTHVGTRIYDFFPDSALLRIHRSVEDSRFEELREVLKASGVNLDGNDSSSLAKSLKEAQQKHRSSSSPFQSLLLSIATRAMTEAQYICTGDREEGLELSHYGLGLEKYTHFTSPIRRYADVVVHKQLLASLELEKAPRAKAETAKAVELDPLANIPESNVVSILAGEGIKSKRAAEVDEDDDFIDFLTEGASDAILRSASPEPSLVEEVPPPESNSAVDAVKPYTKSQVSTICEGLNLHNRLAKHSSYECQELFLSLFFKEHADKTAAVVTNLRENGFWCYVPKYDLRGPVYIRDTNNDVQIDPLLVRLPPDAGFPSTMGFAESGACRRFPDGKCDLYDEPDARLEVRVAGSAKPFMVRPFDVVNIELTCSNWDVRARIPSPRMQLLSDRESSVTTTKISQGRVEITSEAFTKSTPAASPVKSAEKSNIPSLFDVISNISIRPVISEVPIRSARRAGAQSQEYRTEVMKGRIVLGDFQNPDTRSAAQEAALQAAAAEASQRRANALEASSRRSEYDTAQHIQRNITMRQQRLAADKRNTRRSKAK